MALQIVLYITIAIIAIYIFLYMGQMLILSKTVNDPEKAFNRSLKRWWKLQTAPYILSIFFVIYLSTRFSVVATLILTIDFVMIFIYVPVEMYVTPLKSILIRHYTPKLVHQQSTLHKSKMRNDWAGVQDYHLLTAIHHYLDKNIEYIGLLFIPTLKIALPLADYTDNLVYLYGSGMLEPQKLESSEHITIGAHNLGPRSTALFSKLIRQQLCLKGMKVVCASLNVVKEYKITGLKIIADRNIAAAMAGAENTLTLMTCTDDNEHRLLVYASQQKEYPLDVASKELRSRLLNLAKGELSND